MFIQLDTFRKRFVFLFLFKLLPEMCEWVGWGEELSSRLSLL